MNQVWPLRIGRFAYGLLLAMCGLGALTENASLATAFAISMVLAVCGIYLGNKITSEGQHAYKNVVIGTVIGFFIGCAVVLWQNWSIAAWTVIPPACALSGGIIGTYARSAAVVAIRFAVVGAGIGLLSGAMSWLLDLFTVGVDGDTLAVGLSRLIRYFLGWTVMAGYTGALLGAVWPWQSLWGRNRKTPGRSGL